MEHIREYLLSVTAAALLCSMIRCLTGKNGIVQMLCGIFLLLTMIRPISDISIRNLPWMNHGITEKAENAVAEGKDYADAAMTRFIKEQCTAYILDKANLFDSHICAEFTLSADHRPVECTIRGNVSFYAKEQLSEILETDLGIPREDQKWIP